MFFSFPDPNIQILAAPSNCQKGYKSFQQGCYKISTDGNNTQTIRFITSSVYLLASFQILAEPNNCQKGYKSFQQWCYKISTDDNYTQTIRVITSSVFISLVSNSCSTKQLPRRLRIFLKRCHKISTESYQIQTMRVIASSVYLLASL